MALEEADAARSRLRGTNFEQMQDRIDDEAGAEVRRLGRAAAAAIRSPHIRGTAESPQIHIEPHRLKAHMFQIEFENQGTVVGIDLGTTNSLVAWMNLTAPEVIVGEDGDKLVPSVVSVGPKARSSSATRPAGN